MSLSEISHFLFLHVLEAIFFQLMLLQCTNVSTKRTYSVYRCLYVRAIALDIFNISNDDFKLSVRQAESPLSFFTVTCLLCMCLFLSYEICINVNIFITIYEEDSLTDLSISIIITITLINICQENKSRIISIKYNLFFSFHLCILINIYFYVLSFYFTSMYFYYI